MSVEVWTRQNGRIVNHLELMPDQSTTIYTFINPPGMSVPGFTIRAIGRHGVDIIGDNSVIHLPCFQPDSDRMIQKAKLPLPDKEVEVEYRKND